MNKAFIGYCHMCEDVREITDWTERDGAILWECPHCRCYNEVEKDMVEWEDDGDD